jgi:hypothetical protein
VITLPNMGMVIIRKNINLVAFLTGLTAVSYDAQDA